MTPDEFRQFRSKCQELGDYELDCFAVLATTTALRKGSLLPRKWPDVYNLDGDLPYIMVPVTKNSEPKPAVPSDEAIEVLKRLPSYGTSEYLDLSIRPARRDHEVLAMLEMREKIVSSRGARRLGAAIAGQVWRLTALRLFSIPRSFSVLRPLRRNQAAGGGLPGTRRWLHPDGPDWRAHYPG
jgi:hypothetical protein